MCQKLISLNTDLKRLQEENYNISIEQGYLIVRNIPYVNSEKNICYGVLVSTLTLTGDKTMRPCDHICHFQGEQPCNKDGSVITSIQHSEGKKQLYDGLDVDRMFSNKPKDGYTDYYEKIVKYCNIIEHQAQAINPNVSAKNKNVSSVNSINNTSKFKYIDTNSSCADIGKITDKLLNLNIAIIGLGGTGSYILDFVSKTKVNTIHIFDDDELKNHNAFRMPGAVSKETLENKINKVSYLYNVYSEMHTGINKHEYKLKNENLSELKTLNLDFVFICIDSGSAKKDIIKHLIDLKIPFIDVGIDVQKRNDCLIASARTTFSEGKNEELERINNRISFADGNNDIYSSNIQIAEVNAINAVLAIIRWKKWVGIYKNDQEEYNSCYDLNKNKIIND